MLPTNEEEQAEREQLARDYLEMANAALDLANRENFANPGVLEKAGECLMRALQLKPDYLEAFLALAYLSAQVGLAQRSEDALLQAQNLAPHDPRIAALRHEIQNYFKQVPASPQPYLDLEPLLSHRLLKPIFPEQAKRIAEKLDALDFFS
jgi:tetratricopeptide (TPR) repeat protein